MFLPRVKDQAAEHDAAQRQTAAKEAEVDSPSGVVPGAAAAVPIAPSGGRSPPREALDREMLELIKDVRVSIKAPSSPLANVGVTRLPHWCRGRVALLRALSSSRLCQ